MPLSTQSEAQGAAAVGLGPAAPEAAATQAGAPVAAVVGSAAAAAAQPGAPVAEVVGGADMVGAPAHDAEEEVERALLVEGGASSVQVPTFPMSSSCLLR